MEEEEEAGFGFGADDSEGTKPVTGGSAEADARSLTLDFSSEVTSDSPEGGCAL